MNSSLFAGRFCRLIALPVLLYAAVMVFITWPIAAQLSTHIAGAGYSDSVEYARLGWWARYALQHGLNPFQQSLLAYPDGFFSATQWAQPLIYWPIALFNFIFDPVAAFNLWLLIEVLLSGLTAYWLCLDVLSCESEQNTERRSVTIPALIGGLVFMIFPTVQGHLSAGHVNPLSNYALPALALCLYRIIDGRGGLRIAVLGAVSLWILALSNFTFPVYALLPLVLFGGGYLVFRRRSALFNRAALRDMLVLFGLGLLLSIPFYLPLISEVLSPNRPAYLQEGGYVRYSADLLGYIALSPFVPWLKPVVPAYSGAVLGTNSIEGTAYLGIVAVLLSGIAVASRRKSAGLWLTIALGSMIFALGPLLKVNDTPIPYSIGDIQSHIPLPWALFQSLPGLSVTRTPGRFMFMTGLALGVLAALGLGRLLHWSERHAQAVRRAIHIPLGLVLGVLIILEYQLFFPFLTVTASVPTYFADLAQRDNIRAVLDVPWDDPLAQKQAMYQQIYHHKALVAGYVSRLTPVSPAKLAILSSAAAGQLTWNSLDQTTALSLSDIQAAARQILKDNGVDVVVFHWDLLDKTATMRWATAAFGPPAYQDEHLAVFEIPEERARPAPMLAVARANAGWWHHSAGPDFWLTGDAALYVYTASALDQQWTASVAPLITPRPLQFALDGQTVTAWQIAPPQTTIKFWLGLSPGFHTIQFRSPQACTPVPVAPVCLAYGTSIMQLALANPQRCTLPPADAGLCVSAGFPSGLAMSDAGAMRARPENVTLSGGVTLRVARFPDTLTAGATLDVQTEWQASAPLTGDYHLFVHVLDSQSKLIAQADTVPGQNTFPTRLWSGQQTWQEAVQIALPGSLPPGTYSLYGGWYSYPDLTRLKVEGGSPHAQDGLVFLGEIAVK